MKKWKLPFSIRIRIVLIVLCLLAGYCVIRLTMPKQQYNYNSQHSFQQGEFINEYCVYDQIALPAGVYKVQLQYQTDIDYSGICTVKDGTVFHGGLLTNGEHFYKGLTQTDFSMWLYEETEALQILVSHNGNTALDIGPLVIQETGQLWSMLLTIIVCIATGIVGGCLVKKHFETTPLEKEKKNIIFGLITIIVISSIPFLYGTCVSGVDMTYHLMRIEGVKDGILSGQFPVRLEPEWLNGHGYANGVLYCNALLLFPAILRLLGFDIISSYSMYGIALNIATTLISCHCFSKIFRSRYIGLLCSALYTLSVFRIYQLVIKSAIGEGSALTFLPLIVYGLYRAFSEDTQTKSYKTIWLPIAFGYAGIMQTHVLTCEITAFLTIIVCLVFVKKVFCLPTFVELAKGAITAVLLSLWYLVPFLDYFLNENLHIRHVSTRTIQDQGLGVMQLISPFGRIGDFIATERQDGYSSVGWFLLVSFLVFGIMWFGRKLYESKEEILSLGKVAWIFSGILMLMSLKVFPWNQIQNINSVTASLVSSIQYPNRFLGWGVVFLVVVFGCCMWFFKQKNIRNCYYMSIGLVAFSVLGSSMYLLDCIGIEQSQIYLYNEEGMGFGYISGAEYLVEGTDSSILTYTTPLTSEEATVKNYKKKYLCVTMECSNSDKAEGYVELPMLHYTGYRAYAGNGEQLEVIKGNNNVIKVLLPKDFSDSIEVKFVPPLYWRISEIISYLCCGIILLGGLKTLHRRTGLQE